MFKFVVLLSAVAALSAAGTLKVNPDELHLIWETIDQDIQVRQITAEEEIRATLLPVKVLIDDTKGKLVTDIEEAGKPYMDEVRDLEEEAQSEHKDISRCVEPANEELEKLNEELVRSHYELYDRLGAEAEQAVEMAAQITLSALDELGELRERVHGCSNVDCATELEIEVVEFYERVVKDIDGAIEHANDVALIKLPLDLDDQQLDREQYKEATDRLIDEVKQCARERS